jgi:hypothetical protein
MLATARPAARSERALEIHRSPIDRREPSDEAMSAIAAASISAKAAAYRLTQPFLAGADARASALAP